MDTISIQKVYKRYAKIYDVVFGAVFRPGRRIAVDLINKHLVGKKSILEVGVGTGLSLPYYQQDKQIIGIDLSKDMLNVARKRVKELELSNVQDLIEMDAENLSFSDNSFDAVIAMYVASVVPNPKQFIQEIKRVCASEGDIFIVNHFASRNVILKTLESSLAPMSKKIGFRPNLELDALLANEDLEVLDIHPTHVFGYFKLLHIRNHKKTNS